MARGLVNGRSLAGGADLPISLTKEDANEDVGAPREYTHRFDTWDRRGPRRLDWETFRHTTPRFAAISTELRKEDANEDVGAPREYTHRFDTWDRRRPRRLDWDPLPKQGAPSPSMGSKGRTIWRQGESEKWEKVPTLSATCPSPP